MAPEQYHPELLGNFANLYKGKFLSGRLYIRKAIGEKEDGYTLDQVLRLSKLMVRFVSIAHQIELPLAGTYGFYITGSPSDQNRIILNYVQDDLGRDVERIVKNDRDPFPAIVGYLECFKRVAEADFQIALDVHLANFCPDGNGVVRYIDFMPPRQILEDGTKLSVFPEPISHLEPLFVDRIFTLEGQIPDIYGKVLRALAYNPNYQVSNTPISVRELLVTYFGNTIVGSMLEQVEEFKGKGGFDIKDVNNIRIIAVEKFFRDGMSIDRLEHVYSLTHFSPQGAHPNIQALYEAVEMINS